jgi:hypothetical protein
MKTIRVSACLSALIFVPSVLYAQSELGRFEYENSCAACHGIDGKGEGSIAPYLNTTLPDLTQLQKHNEGIFPVSMIFETIEGGPNAGPHGTKDMPAWGQRFREREENDPDVDAAEYATARVLALVEYLSTLQEE